MMSSGVPLACQLKPLGNEAGVFSWRRGGCPRTQTEQELQAAVDFHMGGASQTVAFELGLCLS